MHENFLKIIGATYKLLDYFPEGDPLRNKAKERVLAVLEGASVEDIDALEQYLELAKAMGWIDGMNFLIIKKEWQLVGASLQKQITNNKSQITNVANVKNDGQARPKETGVENYSARQEKILKILGQKEKVQVQDIIKEMPKVTKRTIRRDLDDLLKKGHITRAGNFNQVFYQKGDRTHLLS